MKKMLFIFLIGGIIIEKLKCLLIEPNELPKRISVDNTLEAKQQLVGGLIEVTYLLKDDEVCIICNEEGKINGLPLNRIVGPDIIAGPFLIVGDDYENCDFKSLTEEQMTKYEKYFDKESIRKTEEEVEKIILKDLAERAEKKFDLER